MQQMAWTSELSELNKYLGVFNGEQFFRLSKELKNLSDPTNKLPENVLTGSRRVLETIAIDLCENQLQRDRGNQPLVEILGIFRTKKIVPEYVISSMYNVNQLGNFGAHPKDFDEKRQVKEALMSLITVLHWYAEFHHLQISVDDPIGILEQETVSYELEMVGGAIPLDSKFYIERPVDEEFFKFVKRRDSIVLLKGARQVGKTSLLARGIQQTREAGYLVLITDFQRLIDVQLQSLETLFIALADMIADQLNLEVYIEDKWRNKSPPNVNFDSYFRREVLGKTDKPILWVIDEADRLFTCAFSGEFFALFRTWHNDRALNPSSPCSRLTLAIAYATETYLFIKDPNQSPFNVGTKLVLEDFTIAQIKELNQRYGNPLKTDQELESFHQFLGGQPFLTRSAFNEIVRRQFTLEEFKQQAIQEDGALGDHLRRLLLLLRDPELAETIRDVLNGETCHNDERFSLLRRVGLLRGNCRQEARLRCEIYDVYLRNHLL